MSASASLTGLSRARKGALIAAAWGLVLALLTSALAPVVRAADNLSGHSLKQGPGLNAGSVT